MDEEDEMAPRRRAISCGMVIHKENDNMNITDTCWNAFRFFILGCLSDMVVEVVILLQAPGPTPM